MDLHRRTVSYAELTYLERNHSLLIDQVPWDRVTGVATIALRSATGE